MHMYIYLIYYSIVKLCYFNQRRIKAIIIFESVKQTEKSTAENNNLPIFTSASLKRQTIKNSYSYHSSTFNFVQPLMSVS